MGNNSALFYKQTLKEICIKHVMSSFLPRNYLLNKSKHTAAIKSSATMTLNTVEARDVKKCNLEIYEKNLTTILHLPVKGEQ